MDGVGDGHADGIRQPSARLGEPVEEGVGAAGGVGADRCLPAPPQVFEELGQGEPGGLDVIARGVGTRVAGLSKAATGSPDPVWPWSTNATSG